MFNNVKYECFSQYVILNNARVSALADRVEALEEIAAEYEAERYEETHEAMTVAEAKAGKEKHYVNGEGLTPAQVATLNEYAKVQNTGPVGGKVFHASSFEPLGSGGCMLTGRFVAKEPAPEVEKIKAMYSETVEGYEKPNFSINFFKREDLHKARDLLKRYNAGEIA
ncbi:hypothetical protein AH547_09795 [Salmonella enterica subsp. enterica]|nr:hypothetical protein [Salmonella enterica subsp. enterica serovar Javiana]ECH9478885.1 hypothetical protein [Salmonella enterica subsp. enterica]EDW6387260.1 hypothetical protein [Salmonella enterica subsp. enterica serovar Java]